MMVTYYGNNQNKENVQKHFIFINHIIIKYYFSNSNTYCANFGVDFGLVYCLNKLSQ